ncbi:MAG TPA: OmpA family protein, partial [Candidatus Polarisedimenticolia bacterium]|jgi:chemotaxis protein MotB|nr:OmpA family protein [Candidatus Polarisedimenticolia bacterium]
MAEDSNDFRRGGRATRRAMTLPALALAAAAAVGPAGCVSNARYTEVQQERDLCTTRYEQLRSQVENAHQTGEVLAREKTALAGEKTLLEAKVANLQTQGEQLDTLLRQRDEEAVRLQQTYDGLVSSLKEELKTGQVEVRQLRDGLRVNVAQDILFDSGSAELDAKGIEVLKRVASQLEKTSHQIVVTGHTDDRPIGPALVKQYPTNWELAGARAASVVRLFNGSGLPAKRLLAVSMADVHPVASNTSIEGRARNRRIEIRLRPVVAEE